MVSVEAWEPRVPSSNPRYPLTTLQYLISPPSGQRLSKLLPYCPQTGLTTVICIWGCSSNKPHTFSTYSREPKHLRRHYKKILKPTSNNRRGKSICASLSLLVPTVNDIEKNTTYKQTQIPYNPKGAAFSRWMFW